jgi:hypothetical protein
MHPWTVYPICASHDGSLFDILVAGCYLLADSLQLGVTSTTYTLSCSAIGACQFSQSSLAIHPNQNVIPLLGTTEAALHAGRGDDRRRHGLAEPRAAPARTPPEPAAPLTRASMGGGSCWPTRKKANQTLDFPVQKYPLLRVAKLSSPVRL